MKDLLITTTLTNGSKEVVATVETAYRYFETIAEAVEHDGEAAALQSLNAGRIVRYRADVKAAMKDDETNIKDIPKQFSAEWKPPVTRSRQTRLEKVLDVGRSLSKEEIAEAIAKLQEMVDGVDID